MYIIAQKSSIEKQLLFQNTAAKKGVSSTIIEKDFWVCLTLDYLFHRCKWKDSFAFKGGTSLSKAYGLIERFSEDIDIILDWRTIGYPTKEPWIERSKRKQSQFNQEANEKVMMFLKESFVPEFKRGISEVLGMEANVSIDPDDPQIVNFKYPREFTEPALLHSIRLEIGALAAWTPTQITSITPYAAEEYGRIFSKPNTEILTTTAARTFWEKVTILHQEAFRPEGSPVPNRYSRHYYDLYCIAKTNVKQESISQPNLLQRVVEFKQKFYPRAWARYELAKPGTLQLLPPKHNQKALLADYSLMKNMIFGEYPSYETILDTIATLENEINHKSE